MWEQVGAALTTLGVDEANVDRRGSTIRFAVAEGIPTFVTVEPALHGVDLFGAAKLEVTTVAGDGVTAGDTAASVYELNRSSALGRWLWFRDGVVGRVSSLVGYSDTLSFLPELLPHLLAVGAADAVRASRFAEGRWSASEPPPSGLVSQSEALQWIYDLVGHSGTRLPFSGQAQSENRLAEEAGLEIWYSAGDQFAVAEAAFADFGESGHHPSVFDAIDGHLDEHGARRTALANFMDVVENPAFGKGSLVGLRFPVGLPAPYNNYFGPQILNTVAGSQPVLGLGTWSADFSQAEQALPRYGSFVPAGIIAKLSDESRAELARSLVRDAVGQIRLCARVTDSMQMTANSEEVAPAVVERLRQHRAVNERLLRGWAAPRNVGADVVAFLADDMLRVDPEWSIRRPHRVDWLPHHQLQTITAEGVPSDEQAACTVRIATTVGSSISDGATFDRLNELNRKTCLTAVLSDSDGTISLHTSQAVDANNDWWLRHWLADVAVFHVAVSYDLAGATARGEMPGWETHAYEHPQSGARDEADGIVNAIHALRDHSTNYALNLGPNFLTAVTHLPNLTVIGEAPVGSDEPPNRLTAELEPRALPGTFRVDLTPEDHELLGRGIRVAVSPDIPTPVTTADVSEANFQLASSESGLWMPLVMENDGTLRSSTFVPACLTRGLEEDTVTALIGRLLLEGCWTIHDSALGRK